MKRLLIFGCFCLPCAALADAVEQCTENAYSAIEAYEDYVLSVDKGPEWRRLRCTKRDDGSYLMEMLGNCNDDDHETVNSLTIAALTTPSKRCSTSPNKNSACNELIPAATVSVELFDDDFEAWMTELMAMCEFYDITPEDS